jgi:hypothetical protein
MKHPSLTAVLGLFVAAAIAAPASDQTLTFTQAATIPGQVDLVRAQGSVLYAIASKTLTIFDVANPAMPKKVGEYVFPEKVWGFRSVSDRLYVADGHSGLAILDVSAPSTPRLISFFKTPGQAKNTSIAGNRAFVANHNSGVDSIDISDPAKPRLLGSTDLDGYARDVATIGTFAVAVDNPSGVYVFDAKGSAPYDPVATLQSATAPQQVETAELAGGSKIAVLAGSAPYDALYAVRAQRGERPRGGAVQLVDVSNPSAPALIGSHPTAGAGRRVAIKGSLVYVADGDGLHVLDITKPSSPVVVGQHKTARAARDAAVSGSLVFVAVAGTTTETGELLVLQERR